MPKTIDFPTFASDFEARIQRFARLAPLAAATDAATAGIAARAEKIRWARQGDSLTLDPHAQNEGPTHALAHQIYEPLLHRDMSAKR